MRDLTPEELDQIYPDRDRYEETDWGARAVEATVAELADLGTSTYCGHFGNKTFAALRERFGDRRIRGWFAEKGMLNEEENGEGPHFSGMVYIECTEDEAYEIEDIAMKANGSLRADAERWPGFCEFEVE